MVENALRYLRSHQGCTAGEVVLESNQGASRPWITMSYRAAGNEYGRNVPMPEAALPVLIARFKLMADLDIAERHVSQQGSTSIQYKGKEYELRVSTEPTAPTEKLTLRLQQKEDA